MEAFELRLWDSRIGRWLTTDPYSEFHSPYLGMGNNPIIFADIDGGKIVPAPGIDMARYNSYIAQLQNNFPDLYNYLENHPTVITVSFKNDLGNNSGRQRNGNTSVTYQTTDKMYRSLNANTFIKMPDGRVAGVLNFDFYNRDTKDVRMLLNGSIKTVSPVEAEKLFFDKDGLNGQILSIVVEVRENSKFSTFVHELGHAKYALKNPFQNWVWMTLIEGTFFNPNGKGHIPNNPSGIKADDLERNVQSGCGCDF